MLCAIKKFLVVQSIFFLNYQLFWFADAVAIYFVADIAFYGDRNPAEDGDKKANAVGDAHKRGEERPECELHFLDYAFLLLIAAFVF